MVFDYSMKWQIEGALLHVCSGVFHLDVCLDPATGYDFLETNFLSGQIWGIMWSFMQSMWSTSTDPYFVFLGWLEQNAPKSSGILEGLNTVLGVFGRTWFCPSGLKEGMVTQNSGQKSPERQKCWWEEPLLCVLIYQRGLGILKRSKKFCLKGNNFEILKHG